VGKSGRFEVVFLAVDSPEVYSREDMQDTKPPQSGQPLSQSP